jgi:hypothetical protein
VCVAAGHRCRPKGEVEEKLVKDLRGRHVSQHTYRFGRSWRTSSAGLRAGFLRFVGASERPVLSL